MYKILLENQNYMVSRIQHTYMCNNMHQYISVLSKLTLSEQSIETVTHLPITRMRNRDQHRMAIRGVSGLAIEESIMHTFFRIECIIFSEKYLCKI